MCTHFNLCLKTEFMCIITNKSSYLYSNYANYRIKCQKMYLKNACNIYTFMYMIRQPLSPTIKCITKICKSSHIYVFYYLLTI